MSTPASQLMLRHGRLFARNTTVRHASTTSEATQAVSNTVAKSQEVASQVTSKASSGLSRVQSSAGPALRRVAQGITRTFGAIGGRAERLVNFSTSLIPPTIYYSRVGFELGKLVYRGQKWNVPNLEAVKSFLNPAYQVARHPSTFSNSFRASGILSSIRNVGRPQLISTGIIVAEVLGFFTVGEMIGRGKIIGYRGEIEHGEHH